MYNCIIAEHSENCNTQPEKVFRVSITQKGRFTVSGDFEAVKRQKMQAARMLSAPGTWEALRLTASGLVDHITKGGHWMPALLTDTELPRKSKHAATAEVLGVDVDGGMNIEEALAHPFVLQHAAIVVASATHRLGGNGDKFRIIFILGKPVVGEANIKRAYLKLMERIQHSDPSCKDAARLFFGAHRGEVFKLEETAIIPAEMIEQWEAVWKEEELAEREKAEHQVLRQQHFKEAIKKRDSQFAGENQDDISLAREALSYIPPYTPGQNRYNSLITMIFGVLHTYGNDADQILSEWGQRGDWGIPWEKKIASLKGGGGCGRNSTAGSLFSMAKGNGFAFPQSFHERLPTIEWTEEEKAAWKRAKIQKTETDYRRRTGLSSTAITVEGFEAAKKDMAAVFRSGKIFAAVAEKGSGKSALVKEAIALFEAQNPEGNRRGVLSIVSTRSLAKEQAAKYGLANYQDSMEPTIPLSEFGNVVSVDSLTKIKEMPKLLILDETDSVFSHANCGETHVKTKRGETRQKLSELLKNCPFVIATSADLRAAEVCLMKTISGRDVALFNIKTEARPTNYVHYTSAKPFTDSFFAEPGNEVLSVKHPHLIALGAGLNEFLEATKKCETRVAIDRNGVPQVLHRGLVIASDSYRMTEITYSLLTGDFSAIRDDDSEAKKIFEEWGKTFDGEGLKNVNILLINQDTTENPDVQKFLSTPSEEFDRLCSIKPTILIYSPTVKEGVSLVPNARYSQVVLIRSNHLREDAVRQLIKRARNPEMVYLALNPQNDSAKGSIPDTFNEYCKPANGEALIAPLISKNNGSNEQLAKEIHDIYTIIYENVNPDYEAHLPSPQEVYGSLLRLENEWYKQSNPWVVYALFKRWCHEVQKFNYNREIIRGLQFHDGFINCSSQVAEIKTVITENDAEKSNKEGIKEVEAHWFCEGYELPERLEANIRADMENQKNRRASHKLYGELFKHQFPGMPVTQDFAKVFLKMGIRAAAENEFLRRNPDRLKTKCDHRIASEVAKRLKGGEGSNIYDHMDLRLQKNRIRIIGWIIETIQEATKTGGTLSKTHPIIKKICTHLKRKDLKKLTGFAHPSPHNPIRGINRLLSLFGYTLETAETRGQHTLVQDEYIEDLVAAIGRRYAVRDAELPPTLVTTEEKENLKTQFVEILRTQQNMDSINQIDNQEKLNNHFKLVPGQWIHYDGSDGIKLQGQIYSISKLGIMINYPPDCNTVQIMQYIEHDCVEVERFKNVKLFIQDGDEQRPDQWRGGYSLLTNNTGENEIELIAKKV